MKLFYVSANPHVEVNIRQSGEYWQFAHVIFHVASVKDHRRDSGNVRLFRKADLPKITPISDQPYPPTPPWRIHGHARFP